MVYSVQSDTEDIFGPDNVSKWADLNNNKVATEISARITWAILEAKEQIDARLYGCKYSVPFILVESVYDPIIVTLSARLTGVLLYDNRRLIDIQDIDEVMNYRKMVEQTIVKIHGGLVKLLVYTELAKNFPQAIDAEA